MPLSPIDVEQKTFRVALRGYAEDEVDQFLDEIVIALREFERQLRDANERVAVLEEQLEANRETEDRIKKTLVIAQRTADEVVQDARREAHQIVSEARNQVTEVEVERVRERETLAADLERMRTAVSDLKDRLAGLTDRTLVDLGVIEDDIREASSEAPAEAGFDEHVDDSWAPPSERAAEAVDEVLDEHVAEEEPSGQAFLGSTRRPWDRDAD